MGHTCSNYQRQELRLVNLSTIFIRAFSTHARQYGASNRFERKPNSHFVPLGVDNLTRKLLNGQRSSPQKVYGARSTNHCWTRDDVVVRATIIYLHRICQPTSLSKLLSESLTFAVYPGSVALNAPGINAVGDGSLVPPSTTLTCAQLT